MKQLLTVIFLLTCIKTIAQNKICTFDNLAPVAHNVYVFSANHQHTIIELFGLQVPTNILTIIYVTNESAKCETDSLCKAGLLQGSVFIYPNKDAAKTIRFCNVNEYAAALKSKMELRIEGK